jgi:hypothetical protein
MLAEEIQSAQRFVKTDAYQMSIGEIVRMYEDHEIIVDPEFQRLFRWDNSQKSKLIESILLGIPLPPIFVFENMNGNWELIDGLQRISTLLEFMGKLRGSGGGIEPPSILDATKYLPSLHNAVWERSERIPDVPIDAQVEIDKIQQLAIRRSRIGVEILKRPSDNQTKFDLFQRLNAGGTQANAQELRNCIMLMVNPVFFRDIQASAKREDFLVVTGLSEDQIERQRNVEFAVRFLVHTYIPYDGTLDVEEYIDNGVVKLATNNSFTQAKDLLDRTFALLNEAEGNGALKRFENGSHSGKVGLVGLEGIAVGIAKNFDRIMALNDPIGFIREKIRGFWGQPETANLTSPGVRGTTRIQKTVPFGEVWFRP